MKQRIQAWEEKFNPLSRRERVMVALVVLTIIAYLCYLPLESFWSKYQAAMKQSASIKQENVISRQQIELYQHKLSQDPNKELQQRLQDLEQQISQLDEKLSFQMVDMVPASAMPTVLTELLSQAKGVTLDGFVSIEPTPLLSVGEDKKINLYSHGIRLEFSGDYFSVVDFIEGIETMPSKLYWSQLDYQVDEHPKAKVVLELSTLSINKEFISVAK